MKVVMTWGRFSPPTKGHGVVFRAVDEFAREMKASAMVFASHTKNSPSDYKKAARAAPEEIASILRNPLSWEQKIEFLDRLYENQLEDLMIVDEPSLNTTDKVFDYLKSKGYTEVYWVAGSDRIEGYETMIASYQRTHDPFEVFETLSAGERDPDSELDSSDATTISGTKLRQAAVDGNFPLFASALDTGNEELAQDIFEAVRAGMDTSAIMEGAINMDRLDSMTELDMSRLLNFTSVICTDAGIPEESVGWDIKNEIAKLLKGIKQLGPFNVARKIAELLGVPDEIVLNHLSHSREMAR